jgi:hypothetical protein
MVALPVPGPGKDTSIAAPIVKCLQKPSLSTNSNSTRADNSINAAIRKARQALKDVSALAVAASVFEFS